MREILYPYGLDHSGKVVEAERADRNGWFTCIGCGERVILKRGEIKVAHFAHWREVEGCGGETVLHKMAKAGIKYGIERAIEEKRPYGFSWMCPVCGMEHWGDLAVNKRQIRVEAELEGMRPDLLAVSEKGKALVAIEVIVSHSPEPEAVEAYKRIGLPVVLVPVGWDGLKGLSKELGRREILNAPCRAERCPACGSVVYTVRVAVVDGYHCYRCRKEMRVLADGMKVPWGGEAIWWGFMKVIDMLGIRLTGNSNLRESGSCPIHECPYCGARQGDYNLYVRRRGGLGLEKRERVVWEGYKYCERCDRLEKEIRVARKVATLKNINPLAKGGMTDGKKINTGR